MRWVLLLLFSLLLYTTFAQTGSRGNYLQQRIAYFNQQIQSAATDSIKGAAMGRLAEFFFIYRADKEADSMLQLQLQLAEVSNNRNLITSTLFGNALTNIESWAKTETFEKALAFTAEGLQYAREQGNKQYEAVTRLRRAELYRKWGKYDYALQETALTFPLLHHIESDSLKGAWYIEVGNVFLAKGNTIDAYTQYNSAYDLAYSIKNNHLLSQVYHQLARLYLAMNDIPSARKSLNNSLELNLRTHNQYRQLADYYELARVTDNKDYIVKLAQLAQALRSEKYQYLSKRLMFAYLTVKERNSTATLQYLYSNPDLHQSILNTGRANYLFNLGNIYYYAGRHDSAIYYYKEAEPGLQQSFDVAVRSKIYKDIGECYLQLQNWPQATAYFENAFALGRQINNIDSNAVLALKLSRLYAGQEAYEKAFAYNQYYLNYKDTLEKLANDRSLVLLELEREAGKHEKDLAELKKKELRKHNLQYMGMSLGIVAFFTVLILIGMFRVSRLTVRVLGFFAFICLFEFVILLIDTYLHHATHAEPLKIWIAKIFIIALLLPLHHFLEHQVVHFLESQKLLKLRQRFSVKRFWNRRKEAPTPELGEKEPAIVG